MLVDPIISVPLELTNKADADKLADALSRLAEQDLTFTVASDQESFQTIIAGMSELQLEQIVHRLLFDFNIELSAGKPRIEYRKQSGIKLSQRANSSVTLADVDSTDTW